MRVKNSISQDQSVKVQCTPIISSLCTRAIFIGNCIGRNLKFGPNSQLGREYVNFILPSSLSFFKIVHRTAADCIAEIVEQRWFLPSQNVIEDATAGLCLSGNCCTFPIAVLETNQRPTCRFAEIARAKYDSSNASDTRHADASDRAPILAPSGID